MLKKFNGTAGAETLNNTQRSVVPQILRLDLQGMKQVDIARAIGYTPQRVGQIQSCQFYRERLEALQRKADKRAVEKSSEDPVRKALQDAALAAAEKNIELLDSENPRVAQASAWDILDRTNYPKTARSEVSGDSHVVLDTEGLAALGKAIRECGDSAPAGDRA